MAGFTRTVVVDSTKTGYPHTIQDGIALLKGLGGTVYVERGLYEIAEPILIPSDTKVIGSKMAGVWVKNPMESAFKNADHYNGNTGIELAGFKLVVDELATPYQAHLVYFRNTDNCKIDNLEITVAQDGQSQGIDQSSDLFAAILLYSDIHSYDTIISNCDIHDYGRIFMGIGGYGIGIMVSGAGYSIGHVIRNNRIKQTIGGIYTHNAGEISVSGNKIYDTIQNNGILMEKCDSSQVQGNIIVTSEGHGIYLSGCKSNTVTGNTVNDNELSGIKTRFYGENVGDEYNIFANNVCNFNGGNGIHLQAGSRYNTLAANSCVKNAACGIRLQDEGEAGAAMNNIITGNVAILHDGEPGDDLPISMGHESNVLGQNITK